MAEQPWGRAAAYASTIVVAGLTYFVAQTAVEARRGALPVQQFLDCIQKIATYDWSRFPGEKPPSAREVCTELARRNRR
jgi:hypothetical protein